MKKALRIALIILAILLVAVLVVPLLIPVPPPEDTQPISALAAPDAQFTTINFPGTDGIDIHYRTAGAGEPDFVLLHGFASNLTTWDSVFDFFAERGRTLAYDRPPFGLSERLIRGDWQDANPYTTTAAIDHLLAMLDEADMQQVILVGNSAGGSLAMEFALEHPERVQALILADPAVYAGGGTPGFIQPFVNTPQLRRVGPLVARGFASLNLLDQSYHDPSRITPEQIENASVTFRVDDWDKAFWEFTAASEQRDLVSRLGELTLPTLVITGDDDRIVPTEQSVRLAAELPNAELAVLEACGHVPQEECSGAFETAVAQWLETLP